MTSIQPESFLEGFTAAGVEFFVGVPDSLLKEFCTVLELSLGASNHLIAANEGTALGIATGYHLATGSVPLVYLQNSGLGNAINPLLSLTDPEVYGIPVVLLIGWRGAPGIKDEPQHVKQGRVTPAVLDAMEIPYRLLSGDQDSALRDASWAAREALSRGGAVALLAKEGAFARSELGAKAKRHTRYMLTREKAIECVLAALPSEASVISTTGKISRELYEFRARKSQDRGTDFLTVGSMGHASQIALGISIAAAGKLVICLDGDGAAIMHLGGMTSIGTVRPRRFVHIILNNGAHESVGGQPTVAFDIQLCEIAKAAGYATAVTAETEVQIRDAVRELLNNDGPGLLEVRVALGSRADLGRPKETPKENKSQFMRRLSNRTISA